MSRIADRFNTRIGLPTGAQHGRLRADWDDAQTNDNTLWENDPRSSLVRDALALQALEPKAGFHALVDLAEHGIVWAMNQVAWCYHLGAKGAPLDPVLSQDWYRRAFEAGSQRALLSYGHLLAWGGDVASAISVFERGAAAEWAPALYWLAYYRLEGSKDRKTRQDVRPLLERAAAQGSPAAQMRLAREMARGHYGLREVLPGHRRMWAYAKKTLSTWEGSSTPK